MTKHRCHLYVCDVCYKKLEGYDELQRKLDIAMEALRKLENWNACDFYTYDNVAREALIKLTAESSGK